jgi:ParB-like chromosome segregation protein Spo0J/predicted RNA methylase
MRTAPLHEIVVRPDRQRKTFDQKALADLAESIATKGLLHPIVCTREGNALYLVAGHRRLLAITSLAAEGRLYEHDGTVLEPTCIPFILVEDRGRLHMRETELEENIIREDLTWQDRAAAIDELHTLRQARNPEQTVKDTARELAKVSGTAVITKEKEVARARILAPHLDDPEVRGARSDREAFNIVTRKLQGEFDNELRKRGVGKESPHTLVHGDLIKELEKVKRPNFDCIIADPPYGIDAQKFGDAAKLSHNYEDTGAVATAIAEHIFYAGFRLAKKEAHLFMFCDIDYFQTLRKTAESAGWDPFRTPLIWSKGTTAHAPIGTRGFRRGYELIMFATKGNKPLGGLYSDVIEVPNLRDRVYSAQKPVALYTKLLSYSCVPGDKVLDPCCGSGTIFAAAKECDMIATGIEIDDEAYKLALRHIIGDD